MTSDKKAQADKFKQAAHDLKTDNDEKRFDKLLGKVAKSRKSEKSKVCPECGHVFQGNGWDGIDAHWRSKHESIMPYEDAWLLIKSGKYKRA